MVLLKGKLHAGEGIKLPREVLESSGLRDGDVDLMSGLSPVRRRYDEAMSSLSIWPKLSGGGILKGSSRSEVRI